MNYCLLAFKGKPGTPEPSERVSSVITERRSKHSKKPEKVRDLLEKMYPEARKLELFARQVSEGWSVWGNEVNSDVALLAEMETE